MNDPILLIHDYFDGLLEDYQKNELELWINQSLHNARLFVRQSMLHSCILDRCSSMDELHLAAPSADAPTYESNILLEALDQEHKASFQRQAAAALERDKQQQMAEERQESLARLVSLSKSNNEPSVRHYVIPKPVAYGLPAALAAMLLVAVFSFWKSGQSLEQPIVGAQTVARVTRAIDAKWEDASMSLAPGSPLPSGEIGLLDGRVEITFNSGASVFLQAPARFRLDNANQSYLSFGRLTAHVPPNATGFTVASPVMKVVDVGTEFGMSVDRGRHAEVHVFLGEVKAGMVDETGAVSPLQKVRANTARTVSGGELQEIPIDHETFTWGLPHLALLNRNLVVNGDFETDQPGLAKRDPSPKPGMRESFIEDVEITAWREENAAHTTLDYEQLPELEYPDPNQDPVPDQRGRCFLVAYVPGGLRQDIDVAALAHHVDRSAVAFQLSGWFGGFARDVEQFECTAIFFDKTGRRISTAQLKPVHPRDDRHNQSGFVFRQIDGVLPLGARKVRIELKTRDEQLLPLVTDAYADNISLILSTDEN